MILWSALGADDSLPDDVTTLKAMLLAEREARLAAEAEAQARILLIEKLKLTIKKLRHEQFGQSSERGALLGQLELQLADLAQSVIAATWAARRHRIDNTLPRQMLRQWPTRRLAPLEWRHRNLVGCGNLCCGLGLRGVLLEIGELQAVLRAPRIVRTARAAAS